MVQSYYDEKTYLHVLRVAEYVETNPVIPKELKKDCIKLALMHDLLEDTYWKIPDSLKETYFAYCLQLLTRDGKDSYVDYIKKIHDNAIEYPEVYWVKIADMIFFFLTY